jgi:phosphoglycerol transferase MdoB-like AlkP superfamily enzyme
LRDTDYASGLQDRFQPPVQQQQQRNVHLIVLESFVDPRLIEGVQFDRSPLHPSMRELLGDSGAFDLVKSPVYGSGTAQTEFELLTGLPALREAGSVEFNALEGHPVPSLPRSLCDQGYRTIATLGTTDQFYNSRRAYSSLGFDEQHYCDGGGYLATDSTCLFDGDLLQRNLDYTASETGRDNSPIFNYVVGMYGHIPFQRDENARPTVCQITGGDGTSTIERIANQFYYRTGALAGFLTDLRQRDPEAIVFVTSDHLPPIVNGDLPYLHDVHQNICALFVGESRIEVTDVTTYQVPYLIASALQESSVPVPSEEALQASYLGTIAAGLGLTRR